ncbi:MAG: ABC transporter permease [Candidatus Lokiarchaeota archaeon]|nr:ABC transporter permease [Candidatus Lokiarchaeota archaeon]
MIDETYKREETLLALKQLWALIIKNIRLYFRKGPVLIFGFLFPLFITFSWMIGREISLARLFIGITSMAIFFTSTAISPVILPWETREKGLERQLVSPTNVTRILGGIILASTLVSFITTSTLVLALSIGMGITFSSPTLFMVFVGSLALISLVGSLIGVLISAPPTDQLPDIMTLATLLKFPLVFISGVFIPIHQLLPEAQIAAWFSPLTPFVDAIAACVGEAHVIPLPLNVLVLVAWTLALYVVNMILHRRTMEKRFSH